MLQIIRNGKILIFTLALKELDVRHTGQNLKLIILKELEKYSIFPKHIYSITSDNGSNLVAAVQSIGQENLDSAMNWDDYEHFDSDLDTNTENDESHFDYYTEVEKIVWNTHSIIGR